MAQLSSPGLDDVARFRRFVAARFGLFFDDAKLEFLGDVLRRRLHAVGERADAYLERVERSLGSEESGRLAQELTVPETYFFRNSDQFEALAHAAIPDRADAARARRSLRLLSAGCASGEEAYSLAIVARECVPDPSWDISVRGVDINPAAIERAQCARFSPWALRETPEKQKRWFHQDGREQVLDDAVRRAAAFECRNLCRDDPELWQPDFYDVVFCRNVIMYLTPDHARALVARIARALAPGGYLFLGHAETLRGLSQGFQLHHTHGTFYYQRKDGDLSASTAIVDRPAPDSAPVQRLSDVVDLSGSWIDGVQRASDRVRDLARRSHRFDGAAARAKPDLHAALELLRTERFGDALDLMRGLPAESAGDPDRLMLEALLFTHSGQIAQAKDACARLLSIDALNAGAHYVLALCREAEGDVGGANDHDMAAIYLDPSFAMPRLHLGLLARRAGQPEIARRELAHALALLQREDVSRVLLFGGGFGRQALITLCTAELSACGGKL
jgi:chemotaxis protein methyltransferase CheR